MLFKWCRFVGRIPLYKRQKMHRWTLEKKPNRVPDHTFYLNPPIFTQIYLLPSSALGRSGIWWVGLIFLAKLLVGCITSLGEHQIG